MVDNDPNRPTDRTDVHGHSTIRDAEVPEKKSILPWIIGGLLLLGLLFLLLRGCDRDPAPVNTVDTYNEVNTVGPVDNNLATTAPAGTEAAPFTAQGLDSYLSGQEPVGRAFALDRVTFASGSALLNDAAKAQVNEVAGVLKRYPNARVSLVGYADPSGDAAANQELSARRTGAVRNALVDAGATAGQIAAAAGGETGATASQGNRRVDIRVDAR